VVADCAYASDSKGMHRAVDSADGKVYCYTNFEPADGRRVYANFEQPDLKASFTFRVIAPAHWTVLSNQPAPEPEPAGEASGVATAVWQFPPTPRISTYLTAVVAGEYHLVRESHTTPAGQEIPLGLAGRQSLASHLEPDDMFAVTRQGLDYYTGLFESRYPFENYDQVFVPEFAAGAMENAGCITISERLLFRSKVTDAMHELRATVILHEMAHMCFGDLVTMKWWDDLWLNESFAKVSAALSSVLKQLMACTGRDAFFAGLRAYFTEHSHRNATLADLLRALEASSGLSLSDWAKAWLQTAGPNTLRPQFAVGADGAFTQFAVLQEAPGGYPTLRPHHIALGLYNRQPDGSLLRFDERSLATLTESIGMFADSLAWSVCWSAVLDMVQRAELSVPAFVTMLVRGIGVEPAVSVLQTLHTTAARLMTAMADPGWVPARPDRRGTAACGGRPRRHAGCRAQGGRLGAAHRLARAGPRGRRRNRQRIRATRARRAAEPVHRRLLEVLPELWQTAASTSGDCLATRCFRRSRRHRNCWTGWTCSSLSGSVTRPWSGCWWSTGT